MRRPATKSLPSDRVVLPMASSKTLILPQEAQADPAAALLPPCPAGYRLQEKVGSGGMGEVWKALDLKLGRDVAIKYLRIVATDDDLARFQREAETASRLSHPGVT